MIEESYVSRDTARMLKEAGFEANLKTIYVEEEKDEWAFWDSSAKRSDYNYFDDTIACPTQALAARWLREVYGIHVMIHPYYDCSVDADGEIVDKRMYWGYMILYAATGNLAEDNDERFDNYEQALEAGLQGVVKVIKK